MDTEPGRRRYRAKPNHLPQRRGRRLLTASPPCSCWWACSSPPAWRSQSTTRPPFELDGNAATATPARPLVRPTTGTASVTRSRTPTAARSNTNGATAVAWTPDTLRRHRPRRVQRLQLHDLHRRRVEGPDRHQPVGLEGRRGRAARQGQPAPRLRRPLLGSNQIAAPARTGPISTLYGLPNPALTNPSAATCSTSATTASTTAAMPSRASGSSRTRSAWAPTAVGGGTRLHQLGATEFHRNGDLLAHQRLQQRRHDLDDHRLQVGHDLHQGRRPSPIPG